MGVTIRDLAKHAGVSIKTVSRVLNDEPRVRDATRDKVMDAIEQLGYIPNASAQRLARGRANVIALVFHDPEWADVARVARDRAHTDGYTRGRLRGYISTIFMSVIATARQAGYGTILHPCNIFDPEEQDEIVKLAEQRVVDGFIQTPPIDNVPSFASRIQKLNIPFIRVSPSKRDIIGAPYVLANDYQGAYDATKFLVDQGHERIGFIMGNREHHPSHDRNTGYRDVHQKYGITLDENVVVQGDFTFDSGVQCGLDLLDRAQPPTAIFASNDDMAAGVIRAAYNMGLRVPDDLSVVGFDDVPLAARVSPPLTTVRQPIAQIGVTAVDLLIEMLKGNPPEQDEHLFDTELIIRSSTAPLR